MTDQQWAEPQDDEMGQRLFDQAWELWINPEMERRRAVGVLPDDFVASKIQIVMEPGHPPSVRLNDEVRARAYMRVRGPKQAGEPVMMDEIAAVEGIELTDADPNAGHMTLLLLGDQWHIAFDFRYNATVVAQTLAVARQFLDAAALSLERGHLHALVDTLFSAAELMAKSELLMHPYKPYEGHKVIRSAYNRWGHLGNVDRAFVRLLNRLDHLRPAARYLDRNLELGQEEAERMLQTAEAMHQTTLARAPTRAPLAEQMP